MKNFTDKEIACPCCGQIVLAKGMEEKTVELRTKLNAKMIINSFCRCIFHNAEVGGHPCSLHLTVNPKWKTYGNCAMDVKKGTDAYNDKLIKLALELGWSVGLANSFIHLDRRIDYTELPQIVYYYKGYKGKKYSVKK